MGLIAARWAPPLQQLPGSLAVSPNLRADNPTTLLTSQSTVHPLKPGKGLSIYTSSLIPALAAAKHEILLTTCFWARSETLSDLCSFLLTLNANQSARPLEAPKLRIRLCFSSLSLTQKLFHTRSPKGYTWPSGTWSPKLGLPDPEQLSALDLQVKSIFFRPFSVLHPKYVIVDRQLAFLPSCNVSWETWLECCLPVSGPIVDTLFSWYWEIWEDGAYGSTKRYPSLKADSLRELVREEGKKVQTTLLPSPHHVNPHFRLWPLTAKPPPTTPLNLAIVHLFQGAKQHIRILTPNVTAPPVLEALKNCLCRGVNVTIITNRKMMVLEQLVTAGTITELCMLHLRTWYRAEERCKNTVEAQSPQLLEQGQSNLMSRLGRLQIGYFIGQEGFEVKCHIKCTVVDDKAIILGSGNMDRASWYTSQELGIAVEDEGLVKGMWSEIEDQLEGRVERWLGW